jgi:hypothetical protein
MKRMRVLTNQRGTSTLYASLLSLFIVFSILTLFFLNYFNYNHVINQQMTFEQERLQEQLAISDLILDSSGEKITHVVVNNTGTIALRVRAIYVSNHSLTMLLCDPSTYLDTHIAPSHVLNISLPEDVMVNPATQITVATQRGVKTKQYIGDLLVGSIIPYPGYDPTKLYIGPLMLQFDAFYYRKTQKDGSMNPNDPWLEGWSISKGFGYCIWNITVKNIDDRNITLNRFTSFTAVPVDSPSNELTWYLEPMNQGAQTTFLRVNQTSSLLYAWTEPKVLEGTNTVQKMTLPETRCMVFLTFFGLFHEHDGATTPYAQTIPFEAAITVI